MYTSRILVTRIHPARSRYLAGEAVPTPRTWNPRVIGLWEEGEKKSPGLASTKAVDLIDVFKKLILS